MTGKNKGLIMVYTGSGKGKTTAAAGQALRAAGHGLRVMMIYFLKGKDYGEMKLLSSQANITVIRAGREQFVDPENPLQIDVQLAGEAFKQARKAVTGSEYDLVILDEINVAVSYNLITEKELLQLLDEKPPGVDLVLTGRKATVELVKRADLVCEILDVKHHYSKGVPARKGIEF